MSNSLKTRIDEIPARRICLTSLHTGYLASDHYEILKKITLSQLCKGAKICRYFNSNVENVPFLKISKIGSSTGMFETFSWFNPREFVSPDGNEINFFIDSLYSSQGNQITSQNCTLTTGAAFLKYHEIVIQKTKSDLELYIRNDQNAIQYKFKNFSGEIYGTMTKIFHLLTWVMLASYLCYVMIYRKRKGFVSRGLKDTTRYRPYTFEWNHEADEYSNGRTIKNTYSEKEKRKQLQATLISEADPDDTFEGSDNLPDNRTERATIEADINEEENLGYM